MSGEESRQRQVAHFRGRVQGVGFRYTTMRIAANFAVNGYVQNLPDGQVLVVAEGQAGELDRFFERIKAEMGRNIRTADIVATPPSGELQGFDIRY